MEAVKELLKAGLGVGILAPWMARRELAERSLVALPLGTAQAASAMGRVVLARAAVESGRGNLRRALRFGDRGIANQRRMVTCHFPIRMHSKSKFLTLIGGGIACVAVFLLGPPAAAQLSNDFLTGEDVSTLPVYEKQGFKFIDGGMEKPFLEIVRNSGWNVMRVRLWVAPDARPESAACNLDNVTILGRRIKAAGFKFLLDIHYSDTWADPGHQKKPAAWANLGFPELVQRVRDYSRDAVGHLRANGAMPDIVQVGNEIKNGLLYGRGINGAGPPPGGGFWEDDKGGIGRALRLFAAGAAGVREGASPQPPPLIMLHVPDGQDTAFVKTYFTRLETQARAATPALQFDYDLIGLSYYPAAPWDLKAGYEPWHLAHLVESMNYLAATWHKPVMIVETGWPQQGEPKALPGTPEYPFTPDGQARFYQDLIRAVRGVPQGLGKGVVVWVANPMDWNSVFDQKGHALPAVRMLGQR